MKRKEHKVILLMIFFLGLFNISNGQNYQKDEGKKWVSLFNGKNLDNWVVKIKGHPLNENYKNTFRVVNGVMQVNYDEYNGIFNASYGHIFYKKEFSNYRLKLQYRFTGKQIKDGAGWAKRNSGVMVHCQSPESMELEQNFPVSIEVQLLGGLDDGERPTGNLCTPGTHVVMNGKLQKNHCFNSSSKTYNGDQWVSLEILVRNDSVISHMINGETVITYSKSQIGGSVENVDSKVWKSREGEPLKKGYISLQSESHPVEFKNIELLELN
ncbi:MAG: DUF1080 domain-containing protein [Flavobacteriaceae bacterium]|nr:DUF1080 domain-containing protein [Flavobacteriaceae bacterium]